MSLLIAYYDLKYNDMPLYVILLHLLFMIVYLTIKIPLGGLGLLCLMILFMYNLLTGRVEVHVDSFYVLIVWYLLLVSKLSGNFNLWLLLPLLGIALICIIVTDKQKIPFMALLAPFASLIILSSF